MGLGLFAIFALAVARVTGLITADEITKTIRDRVLSKLDDERRSHRALATLAGCPWCVSVYVAMGGALIVLLVGIPLWVQIPLYVLAASQVAGMTSSLGRE